MRPEGLCPVPLRETVSGLTPLVDDETVRVAARPPVDAGVKIICMVQLAPASRLLPQLVAPVEKLPADGPEIWKPTLAAGAPPLLVIFSVAGALAEPACWAAKVRLGGMTVKAGGLRAVPLRATVRLGLRSSAMVRRPDCGPGWVGAKTTASGQLE